ncbi:hypothetical protein [Polycladidibacter hongkongensis]|uniref:hypothetical protein n=1 Tax=Polycladidibacter hongkongensis TaxID=1647556 RepID=UPI00082D26A0|nr:hypothetical protein [Pseudovibrio hongkongensis]
MPQPPTLNPDTMTLAQVRNAVKHLAVILKIAEQYEPAGDRLCQYVQAIKTSWTLDKGQGDAD